MTRRRQERSSVSPFPCSGRPRLPDTLPARTYQFRLGHEGSVGWVPSSAMARKDRSPERGRRVERATHARARLVCLPSRFGSVWGGWDGSRQGRKSEKVRERSCVHGHAGLGVAAWRGMGRTHGGENPHSDAYGLQLRVCPTTPTAADFHGGGAPSTPTPVHAATPPPCVCVYV